MFSLFHQHKWKKTYGYASFKDPFATGGLDKSGTRYTGQKCQCGKERTLVQEYGTDGNLIKEYVQELKTAHNGI